MSLYEDTTLKIDAFVGWALGVCLACAGWLLSVWPIGRIAEATALALAAFPQRISSWSDDPDWALAGLFVPVVALLVLPGAFGATWPRKYGQIATPLMPEQSWRMRGLLTGVLAGLVLAGGLVTRAELGQRLGVAEADGVTWLKAGKVVERSPWSTARAVQPTCRIEGKYDDRPRLGYVVAFAGHQPADLSPIGGEALPNWIARVTPIDAQLRAAGKPRKGQIETQCLDRLLARLSPSDAEALRGLTAVDR